MMICQPTGQFILSNEMTKIWKKVNITYFQVFTRVFLKGLKKSWKNSDVVIMKQEKESVQGNINELGTAVSLCKPQIIH